MCENIWKKSRYKLFISNWGIAIVLEAGYKILNNIEDKDKYMEVADNIYFCPAFLPYPDSQVLTEEELMYFFNGLKLVSNSILESINNNSCLITLRSIQFSDCDVQNEGFTACAIQWASEIFGFPMPIINAWFDGSKPPCGKYIFDFSFT